MTLFQRLQLQLMESLMEFSIHESEFAIDWFRFFGSGNL